MPRWKMNGNEISGHLSSTTPTLANTSASQSLRYGALCKSFQDLENAFSEGEHNEGTNGAYRLDHYQHNQILDPPSSEIMGRKNLRRFKSGIETSTPTTKPRKSNNYGEIGGKHDRRNYPNPPKVLITSISSYYLKYL